MTGIISRIRSQMYAPVLLRYRSLMKIQKNSGIRKTT